MSKNLISFLTLILGLFIFSSCSVKRFAYFQDLAQDTSIHYVKVAQDSFLVRIQPDDIVGIDIMSKDPALAAGLNLANFNYIGGYSGTLLDENPSSVMANLNRSTYSGYRVDRDGNIQMSILGTVHIAGLTIPEIKDKLTSIITKTQFKDPLINVQLMNFRVSVMGEVNRAGTFTIENREKYSIFDALNQAGDLTMVGKRSEILLFRDTVGGKIVHHFDLRNSNVFDSEYFYLKQNDIVYVPPMVQKAVGTNAITNQIINYTFTAISLITAILVLANR